MTRYFCCSRQRRDAVQDPDSGLNGIDFLEVVDDRAGPNEDRQRRLNVTFLKPLIAEGQPGALTARNVIIEGGDRIRGINVIAPITIGADGDNRRLAVDVDRPGDFSTYTLRLILDPDDPASHG